MSKTTKSKSKSGKKAVTSSKSVGGKTKNEKKKKKDSVSRPNSHTVEKKSTFWIYAMPVILFLLALFIVLCLVIPGSMGVLGPFLKKCLFGLFSKGGLLIPVLMLFSAFSFKKDAESGAITVKVVCGVLLIIFISTFFHVFSSDSRLLDGDFDIISFWNGGLKEKGGGVVGGIAGWLLYRGVGRIGAVIICVAFIILFAIYFVGMMLYRVAMRIKYGFCVIQKRRDEFLRHEEELAAEENEKYRSDLINRGSVDSEVKTPIIRKRDKVKKEFLSQKDSNQCRQRGKVDLLSEDAELDDSETEKDDRYGHIPEIIRKFNKEHEEGEDKLSEPISESEEVVEHHENSIVSEDDAEYNESLKPETDNEYSGNEYVSISPTVFTMALKKQAEKKTVRINDDDGIDAISEKSDFDEENSITVSDIKDITSGDGDSPISEELLRRFLENSDENGEGSTDGESDALEYENSLKKSEIRISRTLVDDVAAEPIMAKKKSRPEYQFPPLSLLATPVVPANADVSEELQTTAKKLVDTLTSFKVRTKIVNISRGPTITRYELTPEEGVRVRAISALVDDISLNLATSGVRIEAPIPGKAAVGIEVPNRVVATVYLQSLVSNEKFKSAASKITVALGEDVAGEPIYVDIAKMPHLLIAGATGMGKSVCINSMLVSLLYKASPEDVRLILIDPKKVELNIYNGLPHLLVPVVTDPKRAAGALQWAVTEMERRFNLIEEVGARDLKGYNKAIEGDPQKEKLAGVVIVIDELADLMMTAPDDVEESICRLAQKARAAGMHLIIGTQRPSVDVITGLIKANIPSRIAFTVASQVDSRTIIDITGAEKLIGRGDMLFSPVGASKPIRVQGSFVSEDEIESIIDFIKRTYGDCDYDNEIIETIEHEAERCGNAKKGGASAVSDETSDDDPMLTSAIELAVDSGKISTSLIQRRLSLGYGRAAKLIDRMQQMGIVSAPEGQKPRSVLITKQQYMEMKMKNRNEDML